MGRNKIALASKQVAHSTKERSLKLAISVLAIVVLSVSVVGCSNSDPANDGVITKEEFNAKVSIPPEVAKEIQAAQQKAKEEAAKKQSNPK